MKEFIDTLRIKAATPSVFEIIYTEDKASYRHIVLVVHGTFLYQLSTSVCVCGYSTVKRIKTDCRSNMTINPFEGTKNLTSTILVKLSAGVSSLVKGITGQL